MLTSKRFQLVLMAIIAFALSSTANAAVIDFTGLGSGDSGASILSVGDATFEITGGTVYIYEPGDFGGFTDNGGICAFSGGSCETDWTLTFDFAVTNVMFESEFWNPTDVVAVTAFNGITSVGTIDVLADGSFGFGTTVLTSLSFDDSSTGAGFGFGDFKFDAAVPLPGTLSLLGLGFLGFALGRRKGSA